MALDGSAFKSIPDDVLLPLSQTLVDLASLCSRREIFSAVKLLGHCLKLRQQLGGDGTQLAAALAPWQCYIKTPSREHAVEAAATAAELAGNAAGRDALEVRSVQPCEGLPLSLFGQMPNGGSHLRGKMPRRDVRDGQREPNMMYTHYWQEYTTVHAYIAGTGLKLSTAVPGVFFAVGGEERGLGCAERSYECLAVRGAGCRHGAPGEGSGGDVRVRGDHGHRRCCGSCAGCCRASCSGGAVGRCAYRTRAFPGVGKMRPAFTEC
jgi:hypothetical protein